MRLLGQFVPEGLDTIRLALEGEDVTEPLIYEYLSQDAGAGPSTSKKKYRKVLSMHKVSRVLDPYYTSEVYQIVLLYRYQINPIVWLKDKQHDALCKHVLPRLC